MGEGIYIPNLNSLSKEPTQLHHPHASTHTFSNEREISRKFSPRTPVSNNWTTRSPSNSNSTSTTTTTFRPNLQQWKATLLAKFTPGQVIVQIVAVLYIMEDHATPHRRRWTFVPGAGDPNMMEQNALPAAGVTNPDIMEDHAFPGSVQELLNVWWYLLRRRWMSNEYIDMGCVGNLEAPAGCGCWEKVQTAGSVAIYVSHFDLDNMWKEKMSVSDKSYPPS
jgi:hypothetical protein